jgi:hypothetical protein
MSSREENVIMNEILDVLLSIWMKRSRSKTSRFYRTSLSLLEIDSSSIWPHFETKSETSFMERIDEESVLLDIEFDIVVKIPPVKERTVKVRVKGMKKATPNIVEPEGV